MLKIAIFGTGGVGGIFGALLAKAGHSVQFIARGKHLETIQSHGLQIESEHKEIKNFTLRPVSVYPTAADAARVDGTVDLVLICVKAWQLQEARQEIAPLVDDATLILPLQNGMEASEILLETYSNGQVLRGFCAVISFVKSPGTILHEGVKPYLCFGELEPPHDSLRILKLKEALTVAGITVETPANLLTQQWQKFLFISSLAAITSTTRLPVGPLRDVPETRELLKEAMKEVLAIAHAHGVQTMADAVNIALQRVDQMPATGTTSMQRDFAACKRSELETFSGYVKREGKKWAIATLVHQTCYSLLLPHELKNRENCLSKK